MRVSREESQGGTVTHLQETKYRGIVAPLPERLIQSTFHPAEKLLKTGQLHQLDSDRSAKDAFEVSRTRLGMSSFKVLK